MAPYKFSGPIEEFGHDRREIVDRVLGHVSRPIQPMWGIVDRSTIAYDARDI
jgi:hypothetical protein